MAPLPQRTPKPVVKRFSAPPAILMARVAKGLRQWQPEPRGEGGR